MPDIFVEDEPKTTTSSGENTTPNQTRENTNTSVEPAKTQPPQENHMHALADFCQNPVGVHFETQDKDETILLFLHKHFATNLSWIIVTTTLLIIPIILFFIAPVVVIGTPFALIPPAFITILTSFYYLIVFAFAFVNFITWLYNVSLVTNKRIIDIDFSEIVYHNVAATKISLIEDVSYTQIGFLRSLFDYGDVLVETAGESQLFDFSAVPKPSLVTGTIEGLIGKGPEAHL